VAKLAEYTEDLVFRVLGGEWRILLPSWLDVADRQLAVEAYSNSAMRMENEQTPPEVLAAYDKIEGSEGPEYQRHKERIEKWEDARIFERRYIDAQKSAAQKELEGMLTLIEKEEQGELEGERVVEQYTMREFSYGERLFADDEFSTLDPDTHEKTLDQGKRNTWLLGKVLLALNGEAYERGEDDRMNPEDELQDERARILMRRMWARNNMDPQLIVYFRQRRSRPGNVEGGPHG
jgi:hypothetical protein